MSCLLEDKSLEVVVGAHDQKTKSSPTVTGTAFQEGNQMAISNKTKTKLRELCICHRSFITWGGGQPEKEQKAPSHLCSPAIKPSRQQARGTKMPPYISHISHDLTVTHLHAHTLSQCRGSKAKKTTMEKWEGR